MKKNGKITLNEILCFNISNPKLYWIIEVIIIWESKRHSGSSSFSMLPNISCDGYVRFFFLIAICYWIISIWSNVEPATRSKPLICHNIVLLARLSIYIIIICNQLALSVFPKPPFSEQFDLNVTSFSETWES